MRRERVCLIAALLVLSAGLCAAADARVVMIVVDGLDAREVTDAATPWLARAWRDSHWCPGAESIASMPTRTNPNHATLITGVEPDVHGITGNAVWDRASKRPRKLGLEADLLTETIFTTAHRAARGLRTAAAVGKPKLGAMFAGDDTHQAAPDELWDARAASDAAKDDVTGYAYDGTTLAAARSLVEHAAADFLFINLSDVDR
jgi:predicted AlkP superfamily pyrophosphatase or phosphodiesterase